MTTGPEVLFAAAREQLATPAEALTAIALCLHELVLAATRHPEAIVRNGETPVTDTHPLVGRFFHTTDTCPRGHPFPEWQGHIVAAPRPDLLLIELFEWIIGEPNGQQFITLDDFITRRPVLYNNAKELHYSYAHGRCRHRCTADDCAYAQEATTP